MSQRFGNNYAAHICIIRIKNLIENEVNDHINRALCRLNAYEIVGKQRTNILSLYFNTLSLAIFTGLCVLCVSMHWNIFQSSE